IVLTLSTNVFLACSGFMVGVKPFIGKVLYDETTVHKPKFYLWLPVVILSFLTLVFGIFPFIADKGLLKFAFESVVARETGIFKIMAWFQYGFDVIGHYDCSGRFT